MAASNLRTHPASRPPNPAKSQISGSMFVHLAPPFALEITLLQVTSSITPPAIEDILIVGAGAPEYPGLWFFGFENSFFGNLNERRSTARRLARRIVASDRKVNLRRNTAN